MKSLAFYFALWFAKLSIGCGKRKWYLLEEITFGVFVVFYEHMKRRTK